jgi:hypothetical protein
MYAICLSNLGLATSAATSLRTFPFWYFGNMNNIAVNTQGVYTEKLLIKPSWHLFMVWFAGFTGAWISWLAMLKFQLTPHEHFNRSAIVYIGTVQFQIFNQSQRASKIAPSKIFSKPDAALLWLGDRIWVYGQRRNHVRLERVYFKDVVQAPGELIVLGYISFMIMMATGRFWATE